MSSKNSKYNIMDNQQETNNYNLMKVIGLSVIMILMLFSFLSKKDSTSVLGIPNNKIHNTDSTSTQ